MYRGLSCASISAGCAFGANGLEVAPGAGATAIDGFELSIVTAVIGVIGNLVEVIEQLYRRAVNLMERLADQFEIAFFKLPTKIVTALVY